jgi:hypothetical protein
MKINELKEKITALIDNEILSTEEKDDLELQINNNEFLYKEYVVQKSVKNLLQTRYADKKAPANLRENIAKQTFNLYNAELESASKRRSESNNNLYSFFRKPQFAIPLVILMIALFLSSPLFSEKSPNDIIIEQAGMNNMYVQAVNNFKSIMKGELSLECVSSNPEEVKKYFNENGVAYETKVPTFQFWNLAGGVISDESGKKFAHQVYAGSNGQILYLYQVDLDYVSNNGEQPLNLSKDMLNYIHDGKCLKMLDSLYKTFVWENEHKVFTLVTNEDPKLIEDNFLASF